MRQSTLLFHLTKRLLETKWRDPDEAPKLHLFGQLKRITRQWLDEHLICKGGTYPVQLIYQELADMACQRITDGITASFVRERPVKALLDPFNPASSTRYVNFTTSVQTRWQTSPEHCHINWAICHSDWEAEFCHVAESHPKVRAYVKNHNTGFDVPYHTGAEPHRSCPTSSSWSTTAAARTTRCTWSSRSRAGDLMTPKRRRRPSRLTGSPGSTTWERSGAGRSRSSTDVWEIQSGFEAEVESQFNAMIERAAGGAAAGMG